MRASLCHLEEETEDAAGVAGGAQEKPRPTGGIRLVDRMDGDTHA